jgi:hypothetical protein
MGAQNGTYVVVALYAQNAGSGWRRLSFGAQRSVVLCADLTREPTPGAGRRPGRPCLLPRARQLARRPQGGLSEKARRQVRREGWSAAEAVQRLSR